MEDVSDGVMWVWVWVWSGVRSGVRQGALEFGVVGVVLVWCCGAMCVGRERRDGTGRDGTG
jgi:hypothetical protein